MIRAGSRVHLTWDNDGIPSVYYGSNPGFVFTGVFRSDETTCSQTWTTTEMTCQPPVITCENGDCIACDENTPLPDPDGDGCPDATTIHTDHTQLNAAANQVNGTNIPIPNAFVAVRFSDGTRRLVLQSEMSLIEDCIEIETPTPIDSLTQTFFVQLSQGGGNATLGNALALRAAGQAQAITAPNPNYPAPGSPTHSPGDTTVPKFTFFIYDHLGNSRILYSNKLIDCNRDSTKYLLEHVLDYYPFGKTLREYVHNRERHQTTYHEREAESGLDFRGARLSDSEVGRFLSVDPKAADFASWSTYSYTFNNPIRFIDPDGRAPEPPVNGLELFADDTGLYYWNSGNQNYDRYYTVEGSDQIQVGTYSANKFKEPVGDYTIIFDLSGNKQPDTFNPEHTIETLAGATMAYLASEEKPWRDISDQSKYPGVKIMSHEDMHGAVTLGNMIFVNSNDRDINNTKDHEYGHYLDFKHHFNYDKAAYIKEIGVPSIISAARSGEHFQTTTEKRANRLGGAWSNNDYLKNIFRK